MARKTNKITVTTPAGRTLTLRPCGDCFEILFGRESYGSASTVAEVDHARLVEIDGIIGDVAETSDYRPLSASAVEGAY